MNPNPHDPPNTPIDSPTGIVDRTHRDDLTTVVCRFLDENITAFDFDEQLDDFRDSPDSAVRFVAQAVWYHYDDCDDHLVTLSKPEWDYFQRLLLLLKSDRCVETTQSQRWSSSQMLACIALIGFLWVAFQLGWGQHLFVAAIPFGVISICISWARHTTANGGPYDPIIFPFATFTDLKATYDAVTFKKARYPRHLQKRRIRSPFMDTYHQLHHYVMWLILSPVPLAFQMFPYTETQARTIAT